MDTFNPSTIAPGKTLSVGNRLMIYHGPKGLQWRVKFRVAGKDRTAVCPGTYPAVSIEAAREWAAKVRGPVIAPEAKKLARSIKAEVSAGRAGDVVAAGNTPEFLRLNVPTFGEMAHTWLERPLPSGRAKAPATVKQHNQILAHLAPLFDRDVPSITRHDCRRVLEAIQSEVGRSTAHRCKFMATQIFDLYGDHHDEKFVNPCERSSGWLFGIDTEHHAGLTDKAEVAQLLKAIGRGATTVDHALQLLSLTVVRQAELRGATWSEFDLETGVWTIPASRMKMGRAHVVPLSRQALAVLEKQAALLGGNCAPHKLVFPGNGNAAAGHSLSGSALSFKLNKLGFEGKHTPHGFRSMFSTIAHDADKDHRLIEMSLAHKVDGSISDSYNSAKQISARRELLQWYADTLEALSLEPA